METFTNPFCNKHLVNWLSCVRVKADYFNIWSCPITVWDDTSTERKTNSIVRHAVNNTKLKNTHSPDWADQWALYLTSTCHCKIISTHREPNEPETQACATLLTHEKRYLYSQTQPSLTLTNLFTQIIHPVSSRLSLIGGVEISYKRYANDIRGRNIGNLKNWLIPRLLLCLRIHFLSRGPTIHVRWLISLNKSELSARRFQNANEGLEWLDTGTKSNADLSQRSRLQPVRVTNRMGPNRTSQLI